MSQCSMQQATDLTNFQIHKSSDVRKQMETHSVNRWEGAPIRVEHSRAYQKFIYARQRRGADDF